MKNLDQTVISQYTNSARLCALLEYVGEWISPDTDFERFYDFVWNVDTAIGYGLDVWGRIVGVVRVVTLRSGTFLGFTGATADFTGVIGGTDLTASSVTGTITVGMVVTDLTGAVTPGTTIVSQSSGPSGGAGVYVVSQSQTVGSEAMIGSSASGTPFNVAQFYEGNYSTTNFTLSDDAFRQLILAKAAANITDGSIQSINQILMNLFPGRGKTYVKDNLNMTMTYTFEFALADFEKAIVQTSGVLPRSTGVEALYSYVN